MALMPLPRRAPVTAPSENSWRFRRWLRRHRRIAQRMPLSALLNLYGTRISTATAYRIAVAEGVRGFRRNVTRYSEFWALINWDLPDGDLHRIWGVSRPSLRQRRLRTGLGAAKFDCRQSKFDPTFMKAVDRERRRAARYDGPRPH